MAFIGIKIAQDITRLFRGINLPGEKVSEAEQHITILCFEENWPIKELAKAMEAAFEVLSDVEPFQVSVSKITCFPKREDSPCPIIAKVEGKELLSLNKKLKSKFDKEKIDYKADFKDFKPHITLSYADEEIDDLKVSPIEFTVTEILLWGGDNGDDRIFITFPLKGVSCKKNSFLIQKTNVFHKLASRDHDGVLSKTTERRVHQR